MRSPRFEAKACYDARATSMAGGQSTEAALSLARLCYDTLLAEGEKARLAAQAGVVTEALERIIEANTYLSGIGFESSGRPPPTQSTTVSPFLKSAITCITVRKWPSVPAQLVLQNSPMDEIETVLGFCQRVGLPVTLAQMGVKGDRRDRRGGESHLRGRGNHPQYAVCGDPGERPCRYPHRRSVRPAVAGALIRGG